MSAMTNEKVTFHQAVYTLTMFGFGSSSIMGVSTGIHQDVWVSILLGALFFIPLSLVYGRIIKLFPEKNLFQVMEITLGKVAGKIFTVLMVWYSVHLAALVLHNFGDFIEVFDMPETPQLAIMILMFLITVYLARSGILVVGKWSVITLFFIFLVMVFTAIASVTQLDPLNLFPLFEATFPEIIEDSFVVFSFPFAESVIFLCLADSFYKQDNVYKIFFYSLAILVGIFLVVFFRNLFLLGNAMNDISYYPSYTAVRTIEIGDYFARMESSIFTNFINAGIVKITACFLAASKGIASLFDTPRAQVYILPVGLCSLALSSFLYTSTMEMFAFLAYYPYYAFPFQVIIPVAAWIASEVHIRKQDMPGAQPAAAQ